MSTDIISNTSDITLNQNEYAFVVGKQHYTSRYIKVRIPKLMPDLINKKREYFNRNIFVNDIWCRPNVNRKIELQDYITVKRSSQCSLIDLADENGYIPDGARVLCLCMNGNYRDMLIID